MPFDTLKRFKLTKDKTETVRKWIYAEGQKAMHNKDIQRIEMLALFSTLLDELPTLKAEDKVRKYLKQNFYITTSEYSRIHPPRIGLTIRGKKYVDTVDTND